MDVTHSSPPSVFTADRETDAGREAAAHAAAALREAIAERGSARVVFASAPSQQEMLAHLAQEPGLDWSRIRSFHMDEYLGLPADHPAGFGLWLQARLPEAAHASFERIHTDGALDDEAARYARLIDEAPIDVVCLGIGVNGHIAFNEPGVASSTDPEIVRVVTLDVASRQQQVDEGLFEALSDVPTHALSLTVPALLSARTLICTVIGEHKAAAVARALGGGIDDSSPASFLRTHANVSWFLDAPAANALDDTIRGDSLPL
ncbi:6-phosphogluconolactonase [Microbacterium sp. A93]|uniref:6-phosphogluconolactonase n=1 Tax=Microbacterium sp. A93 TaxID=3450716 RepID=UPI003F439378